MPSMPGEVRSQAGRVTPVPRVVGKIRRRGPVELRDVEFLLRQTDRATKITLPGPFTLSQQAKNEFYADEEEMAMDYAAAVNAELRDLKASGVDVVQLDEPWVRTAPDKAERYGVRAINRALEGIEGPTVVHLCFGYAHVVQNKPSGYAFLPQLADTIARQISIEAAQPKLDLGVLADLSGKQIMLGVLDLGSAEVETAEQVAAAHPRRAAARGGGAADPGARLRHEVHAARASVREAARAGGRRCDRAARTGGLMARRVINLRAVEDIQWIGSGTARASTSWWDLAPPSTSSLIVSKERRAMDGPRPSPGHASPAMTAGRHQPRREAFIGRRTLSVDVGSACLVTWKFEPAISAHGTDERRPPLVLWLSQFRVVQGSAPSGRRGRDRRGEDVEQTANHNPAQKCRVSSLPLSACLVKLVRCLPG